MLDRKAKETTPHYFTLKGGMDFPKKVWYGFFIICLELGSSSKCHLGLGGALRLKYIPVNLLASLRKSEDFFLLRAMKAWKLQISCSCTLPKQAISASPISDLQRWRYRCVWVMSLSFRWKILVMMSFIWETHLFLLSERSSSPHSLVLWNLPLLLPGCPRLLNRINMPGLPYFSLGFTVM